MDTYQSEEEQVEALRKWWQENGKSTMAAIVVALAASFGWQSWKEHRSTQAEIASSVYQDMLEVVSVAGDRAVHCQCLFSIQIIGRAVPATLATMINAAGLAIDYLGAYTSPQYGLAALSRVIRHPPQSVERLALYSSKMESSYPCQENDRDRSHHFLTFPSGHTQGCQRAPEPRARSEGPGYPVQGEGRADSAVSDRIHAGVSEGDRHHGAA